MTDWEIGSWYQRNGIPVEQHYKVATSARCPQVGVPAGMTLDVARI